VTGLVFFCLCRSNEPKIIYACQLQWN